MSRSRSAQSPSADAGARSATGRFIRARVKRPVDKASTTACRAPRRRGRRGRRAAPRTRRGHRHRRRDQRRPRAQRRQLPPPPAGRSCSWATWPTSGAASSATRSPPPLPPRSATTWSLAPAATSCSSATISSRASTAACRAPAHHGRPLGEVTATAASNRNQLLHLLGDVAVEPRPVPRRHCNA